MTKIYGNGNTPEQQAAADRKYRERQRRLRDWSDELADVLGVSRDQLTSTPAADLVRQILQDHAETS